MKKQLSGLLMLLGTLACATQPRVASVHQAEIDALPEAKVQINWHRQFSAHGIDRFVDLKPVLSEEALVLADPKGQIASFAISDGAQQWRKASALSFSAGPELAQKQVLLGTKNAEVVAFSEKNGDLLWRTHVSSEVLSPPRVAGDMVVVHTVDGKVQGLSADSGQVIWSFSRQVPVLTLRGTGAPLILDDKVIIGLSNGKLAALAVSDGKLLWESPVALPRGRSELERIVDVDGQLQYQDGTLYAVSYQGKIAALTIESGRILWTREMSSYLGATLHDNKLYITDAQGRIWALDKDTGATVWMQDKLEGLANTVAVAQGQELIVGDIDGNLFWLSSADGRLLARFPYLSLIVRTGVFNPADPDELKQKYKFSEGFEDFGIAAAPLVLGENIMVTYRSGVLASLARQAEQ